MIFIIAAAVILFVGVFATFAWLSLKPRGWVLNLAAPAVPMTLAIYVGFAPFLRESPQILWIAPLAALFLSVFIRMQASYWQTRSTTVEEREAFRRKDGGP